jgi:hypothetical protein
MSHRKFFTTFITLLFVIFFIQSAKSQGLNSLVINNIKEDLPLKKYLDQLSSESGVRFFYDEKLLNDIQVKTTDNGRLLLDFLNQVLTAKGILYLVYKENNIILLDRNLLILKNQAGLAKKDESGNSYTQVDIGDPLLAGKFKRATLSGYIRSGKTGESLPGATVYVKDQEVGAATDVKGFFKIELPIGKHEVQFAYVGFENRDLTINMISSGNYDLELFEGSISIDQVEVRSNGNSNIARPEMGIIRMDTKTINSIPVLMGEPDLIKTMTLMPGVQSSGDMSSGFNVRGGNADQNLTLIDDVPIYNSTHLFGMFSIIDSRSIENLELYKGGAPASYGGRASSIMELDLKEGNNKEFQGNGGIGLYNARLTLQGPILKEKASFIISGRTTYSDWILKRVPDVEIQNSRAKFNDLNVKINYTINRKNRISVFSYLSNDLFNLAGTTLYQFSNKLASLKWSHISTEKLTYSFNLYYTRYQTESIDKEEAQSAFKFTSGIDQLGTKLRFLYSLNSKNKVEFGLEANNYKFGGGKQVPYGDLSNSLAKSVENENSLELAGYLQDVYDISRSVSLSMGLRYSHYLYLGPKTVNIYSDTAYPSPATFIESDYYSKNKVIKQYHGFEPRLGLRINTGPLSSIKIAYSRSMQYLHILSNTSVMTPTDIWKSSDMYIKPAMGNQYVLGYFKNFRGGAYESSVELYYKDVQNVLEYKNGAILVLNKNLEQDMLSANLKAYGAEFFLKKNGGKLTGWISYAYSRSFLQTSGASTDNLVNEGRAYPSYYDKPNDLGVVLNYKLTRRLTFGSSFVYSTGRPATYPESKYSILGNDIVNYSDRNKYRVSNYNRLDLSLVWDVSLKKRKKYYSSWIFSVYNVYARKNVYSTYYKKETPTSQNDYHTYGFYELSIIGVPIPSITYNFRF